MNYCSKIHHFLFAIIGSTGCIENIMAELGYKTYGSGREYVIAVHDMASDHGEYEGMSAYLDSERFTWVFVDLRGYGLSKEIEGEYTLDEIVDDLRELMDKLGIKKAHMIGHSMSGMFVQKFAIEEGDRVLSVVGTCPVMPWGYPGDEAIYGHLMEGFKAKETRLELMKQILGDRLSEEWAKFKGEYWWNTTARGASEGYITAIHRNNIWEGVKELGHEILIIFGERDMAVTEAMYAGQGFLEKENVTKEVIPNCGHYPHQETPVYLATLYNRFFAGVGSKVS